MIEPMRASSSIRTPGTRSRGAAIRDSDQGRPLPVRGERVVPRLAWAADATTADLPEWARVLVDDDPAASSLEHRCEVVPNASSLPAEAFEEATRRAYATLLRGLDSNRLWRAWNFIPRINDETPGTNGRRDRYMAFNRGRHLGFEDALEESAFHPVASGVGHAGDDLVLHLLVGDEAISPVDNPRQTLPAAYSERFGHPPPVFSRGGAIVLEDAELLLVSGTASVVGEESLHLGDLHGQLEETMRNIRVVVERAWAGGRTSELGHWLVYLPEATAGSSGMVEAAIRAATEGSTPRIEIREQALCRPELMVEIECAGVRAASPSGTGSAS